jgi:hypothetical protein
MFVGEDRQQMRTYGLLLSHDVIYSHCFGKFVCFHDMQDRLQVQSTPRMTFRQEREDDEDMASMHMIKLGDTV